MSLRAPAGGLLVRRPRNRTLNAGGGPPPGPCFAMILTEDGEWITTEDGEGLVTEQCLAPEALITLGGAWLMTLGGSGFVTEQQA